MPTSYAPDDTLAPPLSSDMADEQQVAQSVLTLWKEESEFIQNSRDRMIFCDDVFWNRTGYEIRDWDNDAAQWVVTTLPERKSVQSNLISTLSENEPIVEREPLGPTNTHEGDADSLESFITACLEQRWSFPTAIDKGTSRGEYAVIVMPSGINYDRPPDFLDSIEEGDWQRMTAAERADWLPDTSGDGTKVYTRPKVVYHRDGAQDGGRPPDDPYYSQDQKRPGKRNRRSQKPRSFRRDPNNTKKAWQSEHDDYLARNLPVWVEIVDPLDCVPVFIKSGDKGRYKLQALITRTLFSKQKLLESFSWEGSEKLEIPRGYRVNDYYGANGMLYLYRVYGQDPDGTPWLAQVVGGQSTEMVAERDINGDPVSFGPPIINLKETYGLCSQRIGYFYGCHTSDEDPDFHGIPFMDPFAPMLMNAETLLTHINVQEANNAFPGYWGQIDPSLDAKDFMVGDQLVQYDVPKNGKLAIAPGPVTPTAVASSSPRAIQVVQMLLGILKDATPSPELSGGGDPSSGHQLMVSNDFMRASKGQILDGALAATSFVAASILEVLISLQRKTGRQIPVYGNVAHQPDDPLAEAEVRRELLWLNERWVGHMYEVEARYPRIGNIAEIQQKIEAALKGFATFDEVREAMGDTSPRRTRAIIAVDRWLASPEGQQWLTQYAAQWRGAKDQADMLKLQQAGQVSQNGMPMSAIPPEARAMAGGQMAGGGAMQLPNVAAASLGGIVSGAMGSASLISDSQARQAQQPQVA